MALTPPMRTPCDVAREALTVFMATGNRIEITAGAEPTAVPVMAAMIQGTTTLAKITIVGAFCTLPAPHHVDQAVDLDRGGEGHGRGDDGNHVMQNRRSRAPFEEGGCNLADAGWAR